ncbi:hypothetical protein, partial [Achromobacter xylosoxidans]|uniref:hypothetical protein n=1 Tax=Alcaligenes xylosoxydans xylosoxydans TaxID=85698 RepID=UPI001F114B25
LQIGPNVTGTVNGKFNANTPTEFMDRLGGVYGFNWFVYAGTLGQFGAACAPAARPSDNAVARIIRFNTLSPRAECPSRVFM